MKKETVLGKLALFAAALIWGTSFVAVKDAVNVISPNYLMAIRFTSACVLLAGIFWKRLLKITFKMLFESAIIGLFLFLAYCIQTLGIVHTTPGKNAFLTAVYCIIVPFLFWLVKGTRPNCWNVAAAILCISGIGLVSLRYNLSICIGDVLTLAGGFFFAAHMVSISVFLKDNDPVVMTILQFATTAVLFWIATFIFDGVPAPIPVDAVFGIVYLCVACTAAALLFQNFGQRHTRPASAALILSLESFFGVMFSILLGREVLEFKVICGFVMIFLAIIISETKLSFLRRREDIIQ